MTSGQSNRGFDIDLREGQAREDALAHVLMRSRVEVKSDRRAKDTGNLFIELSQPSGPSGISTTSADWWAFEYHVNCWLIVPRAVVESAVSRALKEGRTARGGDFNNFEGVLVPLTWLVPSNGASSSPAG